jgi:hypothetical protein
MILMLTLGIEVNVGASTTFVKRCDVGSFGVGSSRAPGAKPEFPLNAAPPNRDGFGGTNAARLLANERYFGLEAFALRAGMQRVLKRISTHAPEQPRITARSLGEDFYLDAAASGKLLHAFLAGGLILGDDRGGCYCPTERFREFALARVVVPLSRARAKELIATACRVATRINADWDRNPFLIETIVVSGSYMSRRDPLQELLLWLVLRRRSQIRARNWNPWVSKGDGLRQILAKVKALSSFIVVRIVSDKQNVPRPFSVVFQASEHVIESSLPAWERVRDLTASISRRLGSR